MKKSLLLSIMLLAGGLFSNSARSSSLGLPLDVTAPEALLEIYIENSSDLPDNQLLLEIMAVIKNSDPNQIAGREIHLCVGGACDTLSPMQIQVETIGIKEKLEPSQFARDVGSVVSSAVGGVHGSATVKVKVTETSKKGADGSSETSKTVDVSVTVSGGKK